MPHTPDALKAVPLALLTLLAPCISGCALLTSKAPAASAWAATYPASPERTGTADIQVFRENTRLSLTNTTTTELPAGRIWLNRRFSRPVDALPPGGSLDLELREFVDQFGTPFRAGGFFATDQPDPVVLVEWGTGGEDDENGQGGRDALLGLVIVSNEMT
ncbi:MAG: hypothetical protein AAF356_05940 [Planctomycetota bacterium]